MKSRKPTTLFAATTFSLAASALFWACAGHPTCEDRGNCAENAGSAGISTGGSAAGSVGGSLGGSTSGSAGENGGDNAGDSGSGAEAGSVGHGGGSGAAGSPPCSGDCKGLTPVCDTASNKCVGCLTGTDCKTPTPACNTTTNACVECAKSSDCKDATTPACDTTTNACVGCTGNPDCTDTAKPLCDETAEQCVACLQQSDCKSATASACTTGACTACMKDADCSNIAGKGVCNTGTCVQCTIAKESVCGGNSCNPASNQCTTTPVGSLQFCQACLADSECIGGNKADPDARCVPMKFMGTARSGGFCLRRVAKACNPPFEVAIATVSLSGAPSETYCGIDQSSTRCEAVLDLVASRACSDGLDTSCGCTRNKTGSCIDAGQGGLCKTVGVNANACTIPCASANQCLTTLSCPAVANSYCQ